MKLNSLTQIFAPCQIRDNLRLSVVPQSLLQSPPPFEAKMSRNGLEIQIKSSDSLKVVKAGVVIYDGRQLIFESNSNFRIFGSYEDTLVISNHFGDSWTVSFKYEMASPDDQQAGMFAKSFFESGMAHLLLVILIAGAIYAQSIPLQRSSPLDSSLGLRIESRNSEAPLITFTPFSGMSLREFEMPESSEHSNTKRTFQPLKALGKTASFLKSFFGGKANQALEITSGRSALSAVETAKIDTSRLLESTLKRDNRIAGGSEQLAARAKSNERENKLRQKLESLKPKLTEAFDQAVRMDPAFSVSVTIEGLVNSRGRLSSVELKSRGHSTPLALAAFERQIRNILESVEIGNEFSGLKLRTEHVFIK